MTAKRVPVAFAMVLCLRAVCWGDGLGDIFSEESPGGESGGPSVELSGEIGLKLNGYFDEEWNSSVTALPYAELIVGLRSPSLEGTVAMSLEADALGSPITAADIIDELRLRAFFPFGYLDAGLLKVEWGKGDGVHVVDPLNPLRQTQGPQTDLFAMKRAEVMGVMSFYLGARGLLELVYKPFYHPLHFVTEGRWAVVDVSTIPGAADIVPPNTEILSYSQGAARVTASLGPIDVGGLYYYGFMSEPGYRFTTAFTGTDPLDPLHYTTSADLVYTRAHLFGLEGGCALGPFTLRAELGYWLTEDRESTQPELYNDRFVYLGGVDLLLPGTGIFVSAQTAGSYVMGFDGLTETDVDAMAAYGDTPHTITIVGAVEIPFLHDTMKIRVGGLYQIQGNGYMIAPEYQWSITDGLLLTLSGRVFGGDPVGHNPYHAWDGNDSVGIAVDYRF